MLKIHLDTELIGKLIEIGVQFRNKIIANLEKSLKFAADIVHPELPGDSTCMKLNFKR